MKVMRYKFKVTDDNGVRTIETTGTSVFAATNKITGMEHCPVSCIEIISETEL